MFILRDFDDKSNNEQVLRSNIEDDISKIWADIYKPPDEQSLLNS